MTDREADELARVECNGLCVMGHEVLPGSSGVAHAHPDCDKHGVIRCRFCPPGCKSCEAEDCECYSHQDWPDTAFNEQRAARLSRCIDASGCDGFSHDIRCNEVLYRPAAGGES